MSNIEYQLCLFDSTNSIHFMFSLTMLHVLIYAICNSNARMYVSSTLHLPILVAIEYRHIHLHKSANTNTIILNFVLLASSIACSLFLFYRSYKNSFSLHIYHSDRERQRENFYMKRLTIITSSPFRYFFHCLSVSLTVFCSTFSITSMFIISFFFIYTHLNTTNFMILIKSIFFSTFNIQFI